MRQPSISSTFFNAREVKEVMGNFPQIEPENTMSLLRDIAKTTQRSDSPIANEVRGAMSSQYDSVALKVETLHPYDLSIIWRLGQMAGYLGLNKQAIEYVQRTIDLAKFDHDEVLVSKAENHLNHINKQVIA